jgi:hypothetical protein
VYVERPAICGKNYVLSFWRVKPLPEGGGYKRRDEGRLVRLDLMNNASCLVLCEYKAFNGTVKLRVG